MGGGGFKLIVGSGGGALPVLLTVPALDRAVAPLAEAADVCLVWLGMALGGPCVIDVWQGGGGFVVSGAALIMVGRREFVFIARNSAIKSR